MELTLERHIVQTEGVRGGKARIADTRITVSDIVIWHFRQGQSLDEIAVKYDLSLAAIYAAISYYFDHKTDVDEAINAALTRYQTAKQTAPSRLRDKLETSQHD